MIHGTEPYTDIIWTPFAIRDPGLVPRTVDGLASTIDIAPTCLSLLGVEATLAFPHSGIDLFHGTAAFAYSQNFTAHQPDDSARGITKAFSVSDANHTLLASSRGLEMYAHRLDPGNHCNLLRFFTLDKTGRPALLRPAGAASHFKAAWEDNRTATEGLADDFVRLRGALAERVEAKRTYVASRGVEPIHALPRACLDVISREGRDTFFHRAAPPVAALAGMPAFNFSYRLR